MDRSYSRRAPEGDRRGLDQTLNDRNTGTGVGGADEKREGLPTLMVV
jgi:hypothetical protein